MTRLHLPAADLTTGPAAGARTWTITLPAGLPLLNANGRLHHAPRARLTAAIRAAGKHATEAAGVPALSRAHVFGILHPATRGRRDPANWYPSFKAFVDGLVDAGVLPDDDDTHLVGPDMRLGPVVKGGQLQLLVIELPPVKAVGR
ncbi:hypothetical protein ABT340_04835 [Streptosporangium sp. NPDC000239]|uniref:hypothetical protein n=1 Tax=Streptosporangium sp. NPDC000239 TaxID=3154248 RepID=UPI003329DE8C